MVAERKIFLKITKQSMRLWFLLFQAAKAAFFCE